jgi:hypothetical protein
MKRGLNYLIKAEPSALHATNLYKLLSKKWVDYKDSYVIVSKLSSKK